MFQPEVFQKQMYCIEVLMTLEGYFNTPHSHLAPPVIQHPGNCASLASPSYTSEHNYWKPLQSTSNFLLFMV